MEHVRLNGLQRAACLLTGSALIAVTIVGTPHLTDTANGSGPALRGGSNVEPRSRPPAESRPNIVLILVDDMALSDLANMPRVTRLLGDAGTTFTRTLSPYPLCCPARATLLTGRYAHNHQVMGNERPLGGFFAMRDKRTLPVWLEAAGYRTMMIGKYFNDYEKRPKYVPPGWSGWAALNGRTYTYTDPRFNINGKYRSVHGVYQTNYMTSMALTRIDAAAASRKPFFLWQSYVAPHNGGPRTDDTSISIDGPFVEPAHQNEFAGARQPRTASFNEDDVSDKPINVASRKKIDPAYATELWQQRQEALQSVDRGVARLIAGLRASGELARTIVAFTSDNGYLVGEHRVEGKILPYEEAVRVPLLIRGPGFPAGLRVRQQTSLADLAPTFVRGAKARPTQSMDGVALQRLTAGANVLRARPIVVEAAPTSGMVRNAAPMDRRNRWYVGVRTSADKLYVEYATGAREYYDMRTDPNQLRNLYGVPGHEAAVRRLQELLSAMKNCTGRRCLRPPAD